LAENAKKSRFCFERLSFADQTAWLLGDKQVTRYNIFRGFIFDTGEEKKIGIDFGIRFVYIGGENMCKAQMSKSMSRLPKGKN
jgi:hypothetical protein